MQYHTPTEEGLDTVRMSSEDLQPKIRLIDQYCTSRSLRKSIGNDPRTKMHHPYIRRPTSFSIILLLIYTNMIITDHQVSCISSENFRTNEALTQCEFIEPIILDYSHLPKHFPLTDCPDSLEIFIESHLGQGDFVINLVKNKRLIDDSYYKIIKSNVDNLGSSIRTQSKLQTDDNSDLFYRNHQFLELHNDNHCHYNGLVNDNLNSTSAISIKDFHLIDGYFHDGLHHSYLLKADRSSGRTILKRITRLDQAGSDSNNCLNHPNIARAERGRRDTRSSNSAPMKRRRFLNANPKNKIFHGPFQSNSTSLYVQLLVVHDHSQFKDYNGNNSLIAERTMQIVNIMNAFYKQLNIFVALVGVVLWTESDEIKLTDDGDATLTNFLKYRTEKLLPRYHHDNAQLITSTSFNGSVVGKALKGPICTYDSSGGVNTDHSHNAAIVAVTLAHELGHNLGMEHDEDEKCRCPDEKCIMSSSSSAVHPKHWSNCSVQYLEESRKHGLLDCLSDEPVEIFGPACGNGFVEEGEDCDLGEQISTSGTSKGRVGNNIKPGRIEFSSTFDNPCCDRNTCKFVGNATCAQGSCCDLTRCSVYNGTTPRVCRPSKTECDLEETCDGHSEDCPPDVHYHDGLECGPTTNLADGQQPVYGSELYNKSRAYCFNGKCASHESQCQLLWGPTGSTSREICYEQNVHGNSSGNCGYDRIEKKYTGCEPMDAVCGMLHCTHEQADSIRVDPNRKTGKLMYGFESGSLLTVSFFIMRNHARIYCNAAIVDAGPGVQDPGLVPNGAACGEDHMCLNQRCVPVHEVLDKNWCPSDCNGNGICDNTGVCHCNDGTIGTSCYQFFGSNFHLSLMVYMVLFFGPIIVIVVLAFKHYREQFKIWWYLHNRKIALKNKPQQRRMAYNADGHKVSISEPIPLSQQQNLAQKQFFDPLVDPWADTGDTSNRYPGYRLEPLNRNSQQNQPLPPLPPPPPPPPVKRDYNVGSSSEASAPNRLKPVRSAPPPPVPPHKNGPSG